MYISQLLLAVIAVLVSGSLEAVYEGEGNIFFTYYEDKPIKSGLRIIYLPLEPGTYASSALEVKIGYKQFSRRTNIIFNQTDLKSMSWNIEGKYYYYDDPTGVLTPGKIFEYRVEIFNSSGTKLYQDVGIPSFLVQRDRVRYCTHDAPPNMNLENKCSDVVSPGIRYPTTTPPTTTTEKAYMYEGEGNIYFTYSKNKPNNSGLRIIYLPLKPDTYANEALKAEVGYSRYTNTTLSFLFYTDDQLSQRRRWKTMRWNTEGEYYYYDNSDDALTPGHLFEYGVEIFNSAHVKIYQDIDRRSLDEQQRVRSRGRYCTHDAPGSNPENRCSDEVSPGIRYPITTTAITTEKTISAGVSVPLSYLSLFIATCLLFLSR